MRILDWETLSAGERRAALARPAQAARDDVETLALEVIDTVRAGGDEALRAYTERFDGVELETLAASPEEFAAGRANADSGADRRTRARDRQRRAVPRVQQPETLRWRRCRACAVSESSGRSHAVGLYVPAGSAPLPSAVIMLAVPARIAGCPRRVLCTPPRRDGRANPAVLVAARLCGIDTVFKVGGAQAIAALAYGSQTVPKVDKIFGPGNAWVTAAKQLVAADPAGAACDMPAGPSEVLVIADETARADFVAADLLAQAEHDAQAQAILVTPSRALAERGGRRDCKPDEQPCRAGRSWRNRSPAAAASSCRISKPPSSRQRLRAQST